MRSRDLPWIERQASVQCLRSLGQAALGTGLLLALLTLVGIFNYIASEAGRVERMAVFTAFGGLALGPAYGLIAKGLLYDPLASGLEEDGPGLGQELAGE